MRMPTVVCPGSEPADERRHRRLLAQGDHPRGGEDGHVARAEGDGGVVVAHRQLDLRTRAGFDDHGEQDRSRRGQNPGRMHIGFSVPFQNPHGARTDADVYHHELGFALQAEMWGFDSIWTVEHHFTDYAMCPDPLQLLTYLAGQTRRIQLGTGGRRAALARPDAPGRADRAAGQPLRRSGAAGHRPGHGQGRVRGLRGCRWRRLGRASSSARRSCSAGWRTATWSTTGSSCGSPAGPSGRRRSTPSGAAPTPPRSRRTRCRSWPSWASASWSSCRSRGRPSGRTSPSTTRPGRP